jgi:glycosyltransferase involved in cell wall biosynthesis
MAAGLAVVGTLTGGTGELLIERENGLTCAAENSHEMAEKIEILLDDPAFRFQLACNGQKRVIGEFSLDRMVDRLENFLKRAVAEHGDA